MKKIFLFESNNSPLLILTQPEIVKDLDYQKTGLILENVPIGNNINEGMQNDEEEHIDAMLSLNNKNEINILPTNIINKEDN